MGREGRGEKVYQLNICLIQKRGGEGF